MKIALDISPLKTGHFLQHRVRGTGFYLTNLQESFKKYCTDDEYVTFSRGEKVPKSVDIIHYPYFEPFFLTLPFQRRGKQVVTVHDLTPLVFPEHFPRGVKGTLRWLLQRRALLQSDAIITDSYASKKDIIRFTGAQASKVHVVYLAAGEEFRRLNRQKAREEVGLKYSLPKEFALYVGDATWNKNLPRLIRAVKKAGVPLVVVGRALAETVSEINNPWNKDLVEVQRLITDDASMHRLGFVPTEDLVLLYNSATVSVMPSLYEGFGLPVLEAMACGSPVITTREGSLKEIGGENVCYADAYSIDSIAESINKVFRDNKLQDSLREKGVKQAGRFSWEKTANDTCRVYKKVAKDD